MSSNAAVAPTVVSTVQDGERAHRIRLIAGYLLAIALLVSIGIYGFDYYTLDVAERPFSPKHPILRPSGTIGLKLGFLGLFVFFAIFLYPLRKRWSWLGRQQDFTAPSTANHCWRSAPSIHRLFRLRAIPG